MKAGFKRDAKSLKLVSWHADRFRDTSRGVGGDLPHHPYAIQMLLALGCRRLGLAGDSCGSRELWVLCPTPGAASDPTGTRRAVTKNTRQTTCTRTRVCKTCAPYSHRAVLTRYLPQEPSRPSASPPARTPACPSRSVSLSLCVNCRSPSCPETVLTTATCPVFLYRG